MAIVTDDFNRADGALGASWAGGYDGASSVSRMQISGNQVRYNFSLTPSSSYRMARRTETFSSHQFAKVTVAALPGGAASDDGIGPMTNYTGGSYYCAPFRGDRIRLRGAGTMLEHLTTVSVGDTIELRSEVSGAARVLTVLHNGAVVITTTHATGLTGTSLGIGANFAEATARIDNFEGGDYTPGDTAAPTLTTPTGTSTGTTTASGSVSTNEANGTLYYLASTNASESAATVKAASSQAVSSTGSQSVSFTGLTAATTYYAHYVHRDAAGNDSAVATSASFTTSAGGDTTLPVLTGSITISALTTTSYTATWPAGSDNVAVTGYEYRIAAGSWVDAGNVLTVNITGRTPGATETFEVRAYDAAGNRSTPALSTSVTLDSAVPTVTVTEPLKNNTGTLLASQSGIRVAVLQAADLVSVYEATGLTTNSSGVLATISNAAITTGQQYHVAIKLADGSVGITGPITAS